jgi:hypothetical protein
MIKRFWPDVEETAEFWYEVEGYIPMAGYERYFSKFEFLEDAIEYGKMSGLYRIVKVTETVTREVLPISISHNLEV